MSAGPDRIVVSHDVDGWRWEYKANGRTIAMSSEAYVDRKAALHGLFLVTGVRLDVPKGWRGTQDAGSLQVEPRRILRQQAPDGTWHGLVASIHDFPGTRVQRHIARTIERAAELGHKFAGGNPRPDAAWAWVCSCGATGDGASIANRYRWVGFNLHARQVVEGR